MAKDGAEQTEERRLVRLDTYMWRFVLQIVWNLVYRSVSVFPPVSKTRSAAVATWVQHPASRTLQRLLKLAWASFSSAGTVKSCSNRLNDWLYPYQR